MENLRRTNQIHVRAPCFRSSTGRAASSRLDIPGWPVPRLSAPSRQNPRGIRFAICFFALGRSGRPLRGAERSSAHPRGGKPREKTRLHSRGLQLFLLLTGRRRKLYAGERSQQQPVHRACRLSAWCPPFGPSATTNSVSSASSRNAAWPPSARRGRVAPAPEARRRPPPPSAELVKPPTHREAPPSARAKLGGTRNREPRRSAASRRRP